MTEPQKTTFLTLSEGLTPNRRQVALSSEGSQWSSQVSPHQRSTSYWKVKFCYQK